MYFTVDDYRKIEDWLSKRTIKDTDFKEADPISNKDLVTIIQDGLNKKTTVYEVAKYIKGLGSDFLNLSSLNKKCYTLQEAINCVPSNYRKLGLIITFHDSNEGWLIYQFKGHSCNLWNNTNSWTNVIQGLFENLVYYPDEEDITYVTIDEKKYLKLSDKAYNKDIFSGKGRVILRKNLTGIPSCVKDDEDQYVNVLKASDLEYSDTVFIVQYDFDLQEKSITIHEGCSLWFQGGTINNGTIVLEETSIIGVNSEEEIGSGITISGNYAKGQILRRTINNREVYAWFNGTEWIPFLDNVDLTDINSHIKHIEDNHLKDVNGINETITKHLTESNNKYTELNNALNNLKVEVQNNKNAIESNKEAIDNNTTVSSRAEETANSAKVSIKALSISIDDLNAKLNAKHDNDIQEINNKITDLQKSIPTIPEIPNVDDINTEITNIKVSIDVLQNREYLTKAEVNELIAEALKSSTTNPPTTDPIEPIDDHYVRVLVTNGNVSSYNAYIFESGVKPRDTEGNNYAMMFADPTNNRFESIILNGTLVVNNGSGSTTILDATKGSPVFDVYIFNGINYILLGSKTLTVGEDYFWKYSGELATSLEEDNENTEE